MSDAAARARADTETGTDAPGLRVPFSAPGPAPFRRARRPLAAAVAAKLALDLLFVCALAFYSQAASSGAGFEGALEYVDGRSARGWVRNLDDDDRFSDAVEVQLFVDGRFAAAGYSESPYAGGPVPTDRLAFDLSLGRLAPGEHEARAYAVRLGRGGARRTLLQIGAPLRFETK